MFKHTEVYDQQVYIDWCRFVREHLHETLPNNVIDIAIEGGGRLIESLRNDLMFNNTRIWGLSDNGDVVADLRTRDKNSGIRRFDTLLLRSIGESKDIPQKYFSTILCSTPLNSLDINKVYSYIKRNLHSYTAYFLALSREGSTLNTPSWLSVENTMTSTSYILYKFTKSREI